MPAETPTANTVQVNGMTITLASKAQSRAQTCFYPRNVRPTEPKDLLALKDRATGKILPSLFDVIPMDLSDDKMLKEYHGVSSNLKNIKKHLIAFDMIDVFTTLFPDKSTDSSDLVCIEPTLHGKEKDLFVYYSTLTEKQVRESNKWYNLYPTDEMQMHVNLIWSYEFIRKNTSISLLNRIDDQLIDVPSDEIGGPLLLWHILKIIYSDADTIVATMVKRVKDFKLSDVPGEDVTTATGQLRAAVSRIWIAKKETLPDNLVMELLRVFQTSS
ncbi:MAG: hypothetical protein SGARI_000719, partial [Bacillariaceae sp.]